MDIVNEAHFSLYKKPISATLVVALVSMVGYLGAFGYRWSFLSYFGIPSYLVDVNLSTVLFVSFIAFLWFAALGSLLFFVKEVRGTTKIKKVLHYGGWVVLLTIYFLPFILPLNFWSKCVAIFGILAFALYLPKSKDEKKEKSNFLDNLGHEYGTYIIALFAILLLFLAYSSIVGTVFAKLNRIYLTSDQYPTLVILGTYSGNLLAATFTPETRIIDGHITILSQDQISKEKITFSPKGIGPLRPSPDIRNSVLRCFFSLVCGE